MYKDKIKEIIANHARLPIDANQLGDESNLYDAGLTSLTTVNLMLALEEHFDFEFPDDKLGRKTFESISSLAQVIKEILQSN